MRQYIKLPKILIVEPHPYHQEILPGFTRYFQEMGYSVDCLIRKECKHSHVFCRMKNKPNVKYYNINKLANLLSDCSEYDYVFFSSFEFEGETFHGKIVDFLGYIPNAKHGVLACHHTLTNIENYDSKKFFDLGRIFSCSGFKFKNKIVPMLAPIYYGDFDNTHYLNKKRNFIVVGAITDYSKNHNLLFETVERLYNNGYTNFYINVIGKGSLRVPRRLRKYIKFRGALSFKNMFKYLEKSDFYLPLMDLNLENHLRYLTNCCSGSRNLVLGFNKPCLINDVFGRAYRFNSTNAIIYKDNDLYTAMTKALNINDEQYSNLQNKLANLNSKIYQESQDNLKKAVRK